MGADSLLGIAILIDELKAPDTTLRVAAIKRLTTIADALGVERTRQELLPFLTESIDDEDEVLLALVQELGGFVDYVGGQEYAYHLLPPLETLATVEETVVRDAAVTALCDVASVLPLDDMVNHYFPLIKRLGTGDWFTSRTSACGLFAVAYPSLPGEHQADLRALFNQLCHDDTPMVRRAASSNLGKFAKTQDKETAKTEMTPMFVSLAQDEQDSVRLLAVENCVALGSMFNLEENQTFILQTVRNCAQDKSWRVRYMVAEQFTDLAEALGPEITRSELLPAFVRLLRDAEAEVRTVAACKVTPFSSLIPLDQVLKKILPCIKDFVVDTSQHVRASLASGIMGMAPVFGRNHTIEHLLPIFLQLLKDDFSEVRLNIISKLDSVNDVIGIDLLSQSLLPAVMELAEDPQWRVRLSIIELIPLLAEQLGIATFDEKLGNLCLTWLGDSVYSIREAATKNLSMYTHPNYLFRMTTISCIAQLSSVVGEDLLINHMLPLVLRLAVDPVPNIRFRVAQAFEVIVDALPQEVIQGEVHPCLSKLTEDSDADVKFFARSALAKCS